MPASIPPPIRPRPTNAAFARGWNVLVVDDESEIHEATRLSLTRKSWRKRPFEVRVATSGREARDLLIDPEYGPAVQVVIVDVVMETRLAGLDLCRFIRSELPRSIRIILRTGQPATAPEERVINDYDIDYYFTKIEATPERLFSAVRACVRISQDMQTLLAFSTQLRSFTAAVQTMVNPGELASVMRAGLDFLEAKHSARVAFFPDIGAAETSSGATQTEALAVEKAHELGLEFGKLHGPTALGLPPSCFVLHFAVATDDPTHPAVRGGFVIETRATIHGLHSDLLLFLQNWTVAMSGLALQMRIARQKAIQERMQLERIQSLANLVTGLSHKVNTPLGVVSTSSAMLHDLAEELDRSPNREAIAGLLADVKDTTALLSRNVRRVDQLIVSFKQLSVSQLSDERASTELVELVTDVASGVARPDDVVLKLSSSEQALPWIGYARHLSQVVTALVQNAARHAYAGEPGKRGVIEVRLFREEPTYRLEVEDYGVGIPRETLPRLFEPFATRDNSHEAGLGLAVAYNIVTNLLQGRMTCESVVGRGSKFIVHLPMEVPVIT